MDCTEAVSNNVKQIRIFLNYYTIIKFIMVLTYTRHYYYTDMI